MQLSTILIPALDCQNALSKLPSTENFSPEKDYSWCYNVIKHLGWVYLFFSMIQIELFVLLSYFFDLFGVFYHPKQYFHIYLQQTDRSVRSFIRCNYCWTHL